jgi:hypothetical protein
LVSRTERTISVVDEPRRAFRRHQTAHEEAAVMLNRAAQDQRGQISPADLRRPIVHFGERIDENRRPRSARHRLQLRECLVPQSDEPFLDAWVTRAPILDR